jgi:hypothetical protein
MRSGWRPEAYLGGVSRPYLDGMLRIYSARGSNRYWRPTSRIRGRALLQRAVNGCDFNQAACAGAEIRMRILPQGRRKDAQRSGAGSRPRAARPPAAGDAPTAPPSESPAGGRLRERASRGTGDVCSLSFSLPSPLSALSPSLPLSLPPPLPSLPLTRTCTHARSLSNLLVHTERDYTERGTYTRTHTYMHNHAHAHTYMHTHSTETRQRGREGGRERMGESELG